MPKQSTPGRVARTVKRLAKKTVKTDSCWIWTGARRGKYGKISFNGRIRGTHTVALELASGHLIPDGHAVAHTCDVPLCVRNDDQGVYTVRGIDYPRWGHLFLCPAPVNQYDKAEKGRQARGDRQGKRTKPEAFPIGERVHTAKITPEQVIEARRAYAAHEMTQVQLATHLSVTQPTISSMLRRATWRHLP